MLQQTNSSENEFPISDQVSEYGEPFMGSINFDNDRPDMYAGDIIQAAYTDADGEQVVLSLTKDQDGNLLDLDFWKSNFTPLVEYPTPDRLTYK